MDDGSNHISTIDVGEEITHRHSSGQQTQRLSREKQTKNEEYPMRRIGSQGHEEQDTSIKSVSIKSSKSKTSWYQINAAVFVNISTFAMIGCAIRIGMETLLGPSILNIEFAGSVVFVSFFSNLLGSFILGLLVGSTLKGIPGILPIYTGLSTGLCGSITTYSKFNQQVSLMIIGEAKTDGDQYFTSFAAIIIGIAAPLCSYEFGKDFSREIRKHISEKENRNCKTARNIRIFNGISLSLSIITWVLLLVLSIVHENQQNVIFVCLSIIMAPFGAMLRFLLAKLNSDPVVIIPRRPLPLGTFLANFLGSVILASMHVVLTWAVLACPWSAVLKAVQSGFCSCLSTVSTFVAEISGIRENGDVFSSHLYPFLTILISEIVVCSINGVSYGIYKNDSSAPSNVTCS